MNAADNVQAAGCSRPQRRFVLVLAEQKTVIRQGLIYAPTKCELDWLSMLILHASGGGFLLYTSN